MAPSWLLITLGTTAVVISVHKCVYRSMAWVGSREGGWAQGMKKKSSAVCIHNKYQATAMIIHNEWHYQSENIIMMIWHWSNQTLYYGWVGGRQKTGCPNKFFDWASESCWDTQWQSKVLTRGGSRAGGKFFESRSRSFGCHITTAIAHSIVLSHEIAVASAATDAAVLSPVLWYSWVAELETKEAWS